MKISKAKLNIALARKCWSQRTLRNSGELSAQAFASINAEKDILPSTAGKLARALGVDVTELIEDENQKVH